MQAFFTSALFYLVDMGVSILFISFHRRPTLLGYSKPLLMVTALLQIMPTRSFLIFLLSCWTATAIHQMTLWLVKL